MATAFEPSGDGWFVTVIVTANPKAKTPKAVSASGVLFYVRAGDRNRTGDPQLGKLMLYRLSYARASDKSTRGRTASQETARPRDSRHPAAAAASHGRERVAAEMAEAVSPPRPRNGIRTPSPRTGGSRKRRPTLPRPASGPGPRWIRSPAHRGLRRRTGA